MTNPDKCANCPVILNVEQEIEKAGREYTEAFEVCMSDFPEKRAQYEYLIAQHITTESEFFGQSEQEITESMRHETVDDMNDAEATITDFRRQIGKYATNCDGTVTMSVILGDGRKFEATVCGSREVGESLAIEPVEVHRTLKPS